MKLDRTEARILGALIEKRWTTPDLYPLSLNALVAACNQRSNRDPVLALEEFEVSGCLLGLRQRGLAIVHEREGGRVPRYSGKLGDELGISREEESIVAELLLRGPQTAPELARRCSRMASIAGPDHVQALLAGLRDRGRVELLPRGSGQRHARWKECLTVAVTTETEVPVEEEAPAPTPSPAAPASASGPAPAPAEAAPPSLRDEVDTLRAEVDALRQRVASLEELIAD